jgi:hypothetical protein
MSLVKNLLVHLYVHTHLYYSIKNLMWAPWRYHGFAPPSPSSYDWPTPKAWAHILPTLRPRLTMLPPTRPATTVTPTSPAQVSSHLLALRIRAPQAPRPCSPMVLPSYVSLPMLPPLGPSYLAAPRICPPHALGSILQFGNIGFLVPRLEAPPVTREFAIGDRRDLAIRDRCRFDNVERTIQITPTSAHAKCASHPSPPIYTTIVLMPLCVFRPRIWTSCTCSCDKSQG